MASSMHFRVNFSASPSNNASAAMVVAFRAPSGLPAGLPDWPFLNLPACCSPVLSGDIVPLRCSAAVLVGQRRRRFRLLPTGRPIASSRIVPLSLLIIGQNWIWNYGCFCSRLTPLLSDRGEKSAKGKIEQIWPECWPTMCLRSPAGGVCVERINSTAGGAARSQQTFYHTNDDPPAAEAALATWEA